MEDAKQMPKDASLLDFVTSLILGLSANDDEARLKSILHDGSNKFTANMFNVLSGFSVMPLLGQLALASVGESHDELLNSMGLANDNDTKAVFSYTNTLVRSVKNVTLKSANKIYIRKGYELNKSFAVVTRDVFGSEVQNIDFSNNVAAANEINQWVEEQTNHQIKDLVEPDSFNGVTKSVLVNAIYFKGTWQHKFSKEATSDKDFHTIFSKSKTTKVKMMYRKGYYNYAESNELKAQILELPYEGNEMSLVVILPRDFDGINELEETLKDPSALNSALNDMYQKEVEVYLPRFKIETKTDLKELLKNLNVKKLFNSGEARLDNLLNGATDLYVDSATQKAFIEVNEEGTEATAANVFPIWLMPALPPSPLLIEIFCSMESTLLRPNCDLTSGRKFQCFKANV
ncbi:unnamed protein product, partial [Brenthis ino]